MTQWRIDRENLQCPTWVIPTTALSPWVLFLVQKVLFTTRPLWVGVEGHRHGPIPNKRVFKNNSLVVWGWFSRSEDYLITSKGPPTFNVRLFQKQTSKKVSLTPKSQLGAQSVRKTLIGKVADLHLPASEKMVPDEKKPRRTFTNVLHEGTNAGFLLGSV